MALVLTEEQGMLRDSARAFLAESAENFLCLGVGRTLCEHAFKRRKRFLDDRNGRLIKGNGHE